jgi:hypothetical protein
MKFLRPVIGFFAFVALLASARAQLVHLAFTEGQYNNMIFRADSVQIPWDHTGGYISRFDLWYDVANSSDPTRNVWRADVFIYPLGWFEIVRSHNGVSFSNENNVLDLNYLKSTGGYEQLTLSAQIVDPAPDPGLPLPPFAISNYSLYLEGGSSFFNVPHFGDGYGNGAFDRVTISTEQSVVLNPVPEPSTYAFASASLLGLVALYRRRNRAAVLQP